MPKRSVYTAFSDETIAPAAPAAPAAPESPESPAAPAAPAALAALVALAPLAKKNSLADSIKYKRADYKLLTDQMEGQSGGFIYEKTSSIDNSDPVNNAPSRLYFKPPKKRFDRELTENSLINATLFAKAIKLIFPGDDAPVTTPHTFLANIDEEKYLVSESCDSFQEEFKDITHRFVEEKCAELGVDKDKLFVSGCWDEGGPLHGKKADFENYIKQQMEGKEGKGLCELWGKLFATALITGHGDVLQDIALANSGINSENGKAVIVDADPWGHMSFGGCEDAYMCFMKDDNTRRFDTDGERLSPRSLSLEDNQKKQLGIKDPKRFEKVYPFCELVIPELARQTVDLTKLALESKYAGDFLNGMREVLDAFTYTGADCASDAAGIIEQIKAERRQFGQGDSVDSESDAKTIHRIDSYESRLCEDLEIMVSRAGCVTNIVDELEHSDIKSGKLKGIIIRTKAELMQSQVFQRPESPAVVTDLFAGDKNSSPGLFSPAKRAKIEEGGPPAIVNCR